MLCGIAPNGWPRFQNLGFVCGRNDCVSNWPDDQQLETAPCCYLFQLEEPTLPLDRSPVSCPSEQPLAPGPVFVGRCPPGVRRAMQFRVPQTVFDPVNVQAESDDGNGSFLLEQVVIAESSRADDPGRGRRGARDYLHR